MPGLHQGTRARKRDWRKAEETGVEFGYRNIRTTVMAPTATIGLVKNCDDGPQLQ